MDWAAIGVGVGYASWPCRSWFSSADASHCSSCPSASSRHLDKVVITPGSGQADHLGSDHPRGRLIDSDTPARVGLLA